MRKRGTRRCPVDGGKVVMACCTGTCPFMHLYHYGANELKQNYDVDYVGKYNENNAFKPYTNFEKQVSAIVDALSEPLGEYDVVITHDILYQAPFAVHNQAVRELSTHHPGMSGFTGCTAALR